MVIFNLICSVIMAACLLGIVAVVIKMIDSAFAKGRELRAFRDWQEARRRKDHRGVQRALREAEKAMRRQW